VFFCIERDSWHWGQQVKNDIFLIDNTLLNDSNVTLPIDVKTAKAPAILDDYWALSIILGCLFSVVYRETVSDRTQIRN